MKSKIRVIFLTRRFWPDVGGVEKHVLGISEELIKRGYEVSILTEALELDGKLNWHSRYISDKTTDKDDWPVNSTQTKYLSSRENEVKDDTLGLSNKPKILKNIIIHRLPYVKKGRLKKFYIWMWLIRNRKIIQTADIVHCHDVFFWYLPLRFIFLKKPVFTTFHGYESYPVPFKNKVIRRISEKLSSGNICIGEFIKKWYGTKPDFISYGAVGVKTKNQKSKIKNTNKKLKILFIGRLEKENGVAIYLSALNKLRENKIEFEFEACGDGTLREKVVQYGKVYGFIENVAKYIEKADVVFASSYLSILESLALKKTVIAVYDNPLKEDYLKFTPFNNWINIVNSEIEMYNKIIHIKNNQAYYNKLKLQAFDWVIEQTWENTAKTYLLLWQKNPNV